MRREFFAKDRAAWRRWLQRHHARETEVHLVFFRKATGKQCIAYGEAVEEALCFGWIDGIKRRLDEERYCFRFTPRRPKSRWSKSNRERAEKLMAAGRMAPAGLAAVEAAKSCGAWETAASASDRVPMPAELAAALKRVATARRAFDALAPGQRRLWRRWVGEAKRGQTRERRAARAAAQLANGVRTPQA